MRPIFALLLLVSGLGTLWAANASGNGFFLSMDQIIQVHDPERWVSRQFVLRQQMDSNQVYFRVPMSDLLYKNKQKFVLPQIEMKPRVALPFFASRQAAQDNTPLAEVLLNERLVLVDSDSLYARTPDGQLVQLNPAPPLGVAIVNAPEGSACIRMQQASVTNDCVLPAFFYTHKGHVPFIVAQRPGNWPVEMEALVEPNTFREFRLEFTPLPSYRPAYQLPPLILDSAGLTVEKLDQMLRETRSARDEVEHEFESYLLAMESALYIPAAKKPTESSVDYALRLGLRDSLLSTVGRAERQSPAYRGLMRELENRKLLLEAYRNQLSAEQKRHQGIREQLLNDKVWHTPFLRLHGILARNLPEWATHPGPYRLWALGLGGSYGLPVYHNLGGELRMDWQYSRWYFHRASTQHSTQNMVGMDALLSWPLAVAATSTDQGEVGGISIHVVGGIGVAMANTQVYGEKYERQMNLAPRWTAGLQIHWTDIALMTECLYRYDREGFGDLGIVVGLPLQRFFTQRKP